MTGFGRRGSEGFGARRNGCGVDRMRVRDDVWHCTVMIESKEKQTGVGIEEEPEQEGVGEESKIGGTDTTMNEGQWEGKAEAETKPDWAAEASGQRDLRRPPQCQEVNRAPRFEQSCRFCGLRNHSTRDCCFRSPYETCVLEDHVTYDCNKCVSLLHKSAVGAVENPPIGGSSPTYELLQWLPL